MVQLLFAAVETNLPLPSSLHILLESMLCISPVGPILKEQATGTPRFLHHLDGPFCLLDATKELQKLPNYAKQFQFKWKHDDKNCL